MLAADKVQDDAIRVKWLATLPMQVQNILRVVPNKALNEFATIATSLLRTQARAHPEFWQPHQQ